jgi:hypothetical protein
MFAPLRAIPQGTRWQAQYRPVNRCKSERCSRHRIWSSNFASPTPKCENRGQFGDMVNLVYDYADGWLSKPGRF